MATIDSRPIVFTGGGTITALVRGRFQIGATFYPVGQLDAPYVEPSRWWIDSNTAWQGVSGGSAPPFPVPDDALPQISYGQLSGPSAPPWPGGPKITSY